MRGRRTPYEIYWEILVFCRTPRSFTGIINRCDLNSKAGQEYLEFLVGRGYLLRVQEGEKTTYAATERAPGYIALFSRLYQDLFARSPGFDCRAQGGRQPPSSLLALLHTPPA